MSLRDQLERNGTRLGEGARKAAASAPGQLAGEGFRSFRAIFVDDEPPASVERFLLTLIQAVQDDENIDEHRARDVYVTARKRRRRLGLLAFGTGPLIGVANQAADLYCETATFCDVATLHGVTLGDEEIGSHMLLLWEIVDDHDAGQRAMRGDPPIANILAGRAREYAEGQLPTQLTASSAIGALWSARDQLSEVRRSAGSDAVRTVAFTGHRTKKLIKRAESQLAVEPKSSAWWARR